MNYEQKQRVSVRVKTGARQQGIVPDPSQQVDFLVSARSPPVDGSANEEVIGILAKHLGKRKNQVTLVMGRTHKVKVFEIS